MLIILFGVSGAGKSTLCKYVCESMPIRRILPVTDRKPRSTEIDKVDKYFMDKRRLLELELAGEIACVSTVYNHKYGFYRKDFEAGRPAICELHHSCYEQIFSMCENPISIYIKPENQKYCFAGIRERGSAQAEVSCRITKTQEDFELLESLAAQNCFDYTFINSYNIESANQFLQLIRGLVGQCGFE